MTEQLTTRKIETTPYDTTIYGVYDATGFEVGKIEGEMITERVRYAGKTYGHDLKPRKQYQVIEILGETQRRYSHLDTLKAAREEIEKTLK